MAIRRLSIDEFLTGSAQGLLLDVRSPGEYAHAHMPGARSLPLFTDEERKEVGTAYKQQSSETAIKIGLDFFGPRMRQMVEEVEAMLADDRRPMDVNSNTANQTVGLKHPTDNGQRATTEVYLYCWRGGMRSGGVAWLLDLYGFQVRVLSGGYKAFRNRVLRTFEEPWELNVIGGYTGSGKTELLGALRQRGAAVVDLEGLAGHRGSAFGGVGPQPGQEQFENNLAMELLQLHRRAPIWVEDECQRIGDRNLPNALYHRMQSAPLFFLEIPFEARLAHLLEEYGDMPQERLEVGIQRISRRLGGLETRNALQAAAQGDRSACFRILLQYYDRQYHKSLHNRPAHSALLTKVACADVTAENADRLLAHHPVI